MGCVGLFIAVVMFFSWIGSRPVTPGGDEVGAEMAAQAAVLRGLKSPSSANFLMGTHEAGKIPDTAGDWVVVGSLDADNSFGARLRLNYECRMRWVQGSDYRAVEVLIDGERVPGAESGIY